MKLAQRHFLDSVQIELGDKDFRYTIKTAGSKKRFSVDYMEFDPNPIEETDESNTWWRNVGVFWMALGALITWFRLADDSSSFRVSFLFHLGVVFLAIYFLGRTSFTHHAIGEGGRVLLIKNRQAAAILRELVARRMVRLRETFGKIDPKADPEREIAKFQWLQREGAVTSAEASARIQEILSVSGKNPEDTTLGVN